MFDKGTKKTHTQQLQWHIITVHSYLAVLAVCFALIPSYAYTTTTQHKIIITRNRKLIPKLLQTWAHLTKITETRIEENCVTRTAHSLLIYSQMNKLKASTKLVLRYYVHCMKSEWNACEISAITFEFSIW